MNELEEKARFFAQYWGQQVLVDPTFSDEPLIICSNDEIEDSESHKASYLLLTSLKDITEEDAIEVATILTSETPTQYKIVRECNTGIFWGNNKVVKIYDDFSFILRNGNYEVHSDPHRILNCSDYLRSQGYALPWNGKSVEQLQELNWIKIIER